jgi:hypothetical protein
MWAAVAARAAGRGVAIPQRWQRGGGGCLQRAGCRRDIQAAPCSLAGRLKVCHVVPLQRQLSR